MVTGHDVDYHATNQNEMDSCYLYTGTSLNAESLLSDKIIHPSNKQVKIALRKQDFTWLSTGKYELNWKCNVLSNSDLIKNEDTQRDSIKFVLKSWSKTKSKLRKAKKKQKVCFCGDYFCGVFAVFDAILVFICFVFVFVFVVFFWFFFCFLAQC